MFNVAWPRTDVVSLLGLKNQWAWIILSFYTTFLPPNYPNIGLVNNRNCTKKAMKYLCRVATEGVTTSPNRLSRSDCVRQILHYTTFKIDSSDRYYFFMIQEHDQKEYHGTYSAWHWVRFCVPTQLVIVGQEQLTQSMVLAYESTCGGSSGRWN